MAVRAYAVHLFSSHNLTLGIVKEGDLSNNPSNLTITGVTAQKMVYISQSLLGNEDLRHDKSRMIAPLYKFLGHLEIPGINKPLLGLVTVGEENT